MTHRIDFLENLDFSRRAGPLSSGVRLLPKEDIMKTELIRRIGITVIATLIPVFALAQDQPSQPDVKMTIYLQKELTKKGINYNRFEGYRLDREKYVKTDLQMTFSDFVALLKHSKDSGHEVKESLNTDEKGKISEIFEGGVYWSDPKLSPALAGEISKQFDIKLPLELTCCRYRGTTIYVDVAKPK